MFVYLCMISLAGRSWTKQISDSMHHTSRTHGTKQPLTGKSNNTWTTVVQKTDGEKVNPGNTRSFSCPDETGGFEKKVSVARAKRTAEWIIEKESVWKLGSVTDLASVCLRSISSRLKLNTMSHSTLRCVYSYWGPFVKGPDAGDVSRHQRCSFRAKPRKLSCKHITETDALC